MALIELEVDGMTCASCANHVEHALAGVAGVRAARVNLPLERASVDAECDAALVPALLTAVERAGYHAKAIDAAKAPTRETVDRSVKELATWRNYLLVGAVWVTPMVALHFWGGHSSSVIWLQFLLATAMQATVGRPYLVTALKRLRHAAPNMDSLVEMGSLAAYLAGVYAMVCGIHDMYFMDSALILEFVSLGKYLEIRAKRRASLAIRKLLDLSPAEAQIVRGSQTVVVSVDQVLAGETMIVRPGDRVPLDAKITEGTSTLDQAWLTGESMPVDKLRGDEILAGAINGSGLLTAIVTKAASDTALARVVRLVHRAQESKADVQRFADRVVGWFVPTIIAIATLTLIAWGLLGSDWNRGLASAVAVIVVACPCALGLATPTAILVASGRGAELGILVKEAHSLEIAGEVTCVVFDKTGTITTGKLRLTDVLPVENVSIERLLALAAAAEQHSSHPLAAPIVAAATERGLAIPTSGSLQLVAGGGLVAQVNLLPVLVGNERLLKERSIDINAAASNITQLRQQGKTPLLVAENGKLLGVIALADSIATHSRDAIATLRKLGIKPLLLSGDAWATVEAVAREVGIGNSKSEYRAGTRIVSESLKDSASWSEVEAEVLPERKRDVVAALQAAGEVVAMVGDGINDAPALATANLGIAIGNGADVAIETADVVIAGNDLRKVASTVVLARATLRTIRQNLGWAFGYNLLLLPLATGILLPFGGPHLPPIAAAAAMSLSSVSVVMNSLLLRWRISRQTATLE